MKFYTYIHKRADDGVVFYIGKGQGNRHQDTRSRNRYWRNVVAKHGFTAEILSHWPTEDEAFEHEKLLIECFRDMGYKLVNMTDGGEGPSGMVHSEETRARLSEQSRQYYANPEARALAAEQSRQYWDDPEARARLSEQMRQRMSSPEARARQSEKVRQYWDDPEARASRSEQSRQYWADPEARARQSEKVRQQWLSPEARARRSEQMRQSHANPEARARLSEQARQHMSSPEARAAVGDRTRGSVWVTNGTANRQLKPGAPMPAGFRRGKVKRSVPSRAA